MNRILYFNIDYRCNNACVFCFSHNVGNGRADIQFDSFKKILEEIKADNRDLIIINGGEPTIHPQFSNFVSYIGEQCLPCRIYSNGTRINSDTYPTAFDNIRFIIPIHGEKEVHDFITGRNGAFNDTLASLAYLESINTNYRLKFIVTQELIDSCFSIKRFISDNNLNPEEIYLARVNATAKSHINNYQVLSLERTEKYISHAQTELYKHYTIKYVDLPACVIQDCRINIPIPSAIDFYFNDVDIKLQKRDYVKEHFLRDRCATCPYSLVCDILSNSYYVICSTPDGNYKLEVE